MKLSEAMELLDMCDREELRDHAFGDREVEWYYDGKNVASGYFGGGGDGIGIYDFERIKSSGFYLEIASFEGEEARELVRKGKNVRIERNDMQGDYIPRYQGA